MRIRWLRAALDDLENLRAYIAQDAPDTAEMVAERIQDAVRGLAEYPELGRSGSVIGTRELVVARLPYVVIYRVRATTVRVLRILHAAQRWPIR